MRVCFSGSHEVPVARTLRVFDLGGRFKKDNDLGRETRGGQQEGNLPIDTLEELNNPAHHLNNLKQKNIPLPDKAKHI